MVASGSRQKIQERREIKGPSSNLIYVYECHESLKPERYIGYITGNATIITSLTKIGKVLTLYQLLCIYNCFP